jgi:hypothetical protein
MELMLGNWDVMEYKTAFIFQKIYGLFMSEHNVSIGIPRQKHFPPFSVIKS